MNPGTVGKLKLHYIYYGKVPIQTDRLGKFHDITCPDDPKHEGPRWNDETSISSRILLVPSHALA